MKITRFRGAAALPVALCASAAAADQSHQALGADSHAPAGVMFDHVHKSGEVMVGLTWMHESHGGTNQSGTAALADAQIAAAGFTSRTQAMTMDMAMLHVMWAPSDQVTLMVMPSWMRMKMTMLGIAPSAGHHGLAVGESKAHSTAGISDTQIGALVALSRQSAFSAHAGMMLSVPTGSVARKDSDGNFVHYGMQPGSGTWDLQPSLTLRGASARLSWGMQTSYLARTGKAGDTGFKFGDRFATTGWLSKALGRHASASARLAYQSEGAIKGHYNAGHSHGSPPDRQANYGGKRLDAGLGVNVLAGEKLRLGGEISLPLWQSLNGIQTPKRLGISVNASRAF